MKKILPLLWIFIATLSRLLPHPADMTPFTNLCLLAGNQLNKATAFITTVIALVLSDLLLSHINGYSVFGTWSWFTYSGFIMVMLLGNLLRKRINKKTLLPTVISVSIFYWLWTNFGTWLVTSMYAKTWAGLITCYIAALPFLQNSLLGDLGGAMVIWGAYYFCMTLKSRRGRDFSQNTLKIGN